MNCPYQNQEFIKTVQVVPYESMSGMRGILYGLLFLAIALGAIWIGAAL
jgi:hypothetical protein